MTAIPLGTLVNAVIVSKYDDFFEALVEDKFIGILPKFHLNDEILGAEHCFDITNIGESVTCVVLKHEESKLILTTRQSFISKRLSIPCTSFSLRLHSKTYGYVNNVNEDGSEVCFFGNATGFIPNEELRIGDTVYVENIKSGMLPILKSCSNKNLDTIFIQNYMNKMMYIETEYRIWSRALTSKLKLVSREDGHFIYETKNKWRIVVFDTFNKEEPTTVTICYIDVENKCYFAYDISNYKTIIPPLTFRGICVAKFEFISIIRYRQCFFYIKTRQDLMVGMLVYASTSFDVANRNVIFNGFGDENYIYTPGNLFIGLIEFPTNDYVTNNEEFQIDFLYREWAFCTNAQNDYFLIHRTQMKGDLYKGKRVYGDYLCLEGIRIIIPNKELPLYYENCMENMLVYGALVKYDKSGKRHLIAISPFIESYIKEKNISDTLFNTYMCYIVGTTENSIKCSMEPSRIEVVINNYIPGLYYETENEEGKKFLLDVTNCGNTISTEGIGATLCSCIARKYIVYKFEEDRVALIPPVISHEHFKVGTYLQGYIYKIEKNNIFIHISHGLNGRIPIEFYSDFYPSMNPVKTPEIGEKLECTVIENSEEVLTLSCRERDLINYCDDYVTKLSPSEYIRRYLAIDSFRENNYYHAIVTGVDDMIFIYIDTFRKNTKVVSQLFSTTEPETNRPIDKNEIEIGQDVWVVCKTKKEFQIVSLNNTLEYYSEDSQEETEEFPVAFEEHYNDSSDDSEEFPTAFEEHYNDIRLMKNLREEKSKYQTKLKQCGDKDILALKPILHRKYASKGTINKKNLQPLIHLLKTHETINDIDLICFKTNISPKTLRKWHEKVRKDRDWSPLVCTNYVRRKAMDDLMEDSIIYHICTKFLTKGYQFNDRMCKTIALQFWEQFPEHRLMDNFTASNNWISRFKRKYHLVNRKVHYHRRPFANELTIGRCYEFINEITKIYENHKKSHTLEYLINIDETAWKICNFGDLTWASKGCEHIEFSSNFNEKEMITVIAAISAASEESKLPLCLIKKGKTNRSTRVFNDIKQYFQINVSENGWSNVSCFANYLIWLRNEINERYKNKEGYSPEQKIDLILDLYASHRNEKVKELARKLNFELHYIPAGFTDSLQPLDRYIFGALKSMARAEFYREYTKNPEAKQTIEHACEILLDSWNRLSEATLKKAWNPYADPGNEDIDSLINRSTIEIKVNEEELLKLNEENYTLSSHFPHVSDVTYSSSEESEDSDCEFDDLEEDTLIEENVIDQMKELNLIESLNEHEKLIKPIINTWGTCNANTTLQTVLMIPGIRDQLRHYEKVGLLKNDKLLKAIYDFIKIYDKSKTTVEIQALDSCFDLYTDACDNINYVLKKMDYGLTKKGEELLSIVQLMPQGRNTVKTEKEMLSDLINEQEFIFNKVIAFRKNPTDNHDYPSSFAFREYIFILKAVVRNTVDTHFYVYIRKKFSSEFVLADDASIRIASKEQINMSSTVLGIYIVFKNENEVEDKDINKYSTPAMKTIKEPIVINDEIAKIVECIEKESRKERKNSEIIQYRKDLKEITPMVRIEFPAKEDDYLSFFK